MTSRLFLLASLMAASLSACAGDSSTAACIKADTIAAPDTVKVFAPTTCP